MSEEEICQMIECGKHLVPDHMWSGVSNYFVRRITPGSFLRALLENRDVLTVVAMADDVNVISLQKWVRFLYNYVPGNSWGSPDKVQDWLLGP